MGLEGIIAKKADAPYRAGRTNQWYNIKSQHSGDFVIVGFTAPQGNRTGFGALQIGDYVDGKLVYAGRAGTGFTEKQLQEIHAMLLPDVRAEPACFGPVKARGQEPLPSESSPETGSTTWVEPRHVCEVRYTEWTPDGVLRHPAFLRLRDDKRPHECERQDWRNVDSGATAPATPAPPPATAPKESALDVAPDLPPRVVPKTVNISNPNKVFWPAEKYTKGDMIEYYRGIAPWLLPYLKDRPVVLTRFPDGIEGKSFYQKDAPDFAPEWMRTVPIWSSDTNRFIQYFLCDDIDGLTYLANSGTIPLHIWMSRVESLERPDWCVIDLDPKEAPFSDVVKTALVLHRICGEIGLPDYIKTTGKTGLHIMIPLGRQVTYEQCRTLGELLARLVIRDLGDITTITRHVTRRGDKVYLDYLQNRHGQLIVSPFSVRPLPGATVSMPITWDEVNQDLDPRAFTIKNAVDRMTALGEDPVRPVIDERADLAAVMTRLATIMAG
jgi:bifunctional non-homologous end joining protein LigD